MKRKLTSFFALTLVLSSLLGSCKKDKDPEPDTNLQIETQADDEAQVSSQLDEITAEAALIVENNPATSGDNSVLDFPICDAAIDVNVNSNPMTATITYDGSSCRSDRTRTGKVVISIAQGTQWKNAGAAMTIEFQNLKITRKRDNKSLTINGSKTYTNVSGGLLLNLANSENIVHTVTSNGLSIKFNNETAREWKIARQYNFSYDGGVVIAISGMHAENNMDGIVAWGTNRFGRAFTTVINEALIVKQSCDLRITGGVLTHATPAYSATATFGLNASGEATGCQTAGNYYYQLEATGPNGGTFSKLINY